VRNIVGKGRRFRFRGGTSDNREPGFPEPADNDFPMAGKAMPVHRMSAENRFAVMAAHDSCSSGSTVKGAPDRAHAWCADEEPAVRFQLAFLELFASVMIMDVQGDLIIERVMNAR
jgi:hypothetical protein